MWENICSVFWFFTSSRLTVDQKIGLVTWDGHLDFVTLSVDQGCRRAGNNKIAYRHQDELKISRASVSFKRTLPDILIGCSNRFLNHSRLSTRPWWDCSQTERWREALCPGEPAQTALRFQKEVAGSTGRWDYLTLEENRKLERHVLNLSSKQLFAVVSVNNQHRSINDFNDSGMTSYTLLCNIKWFCTPMHTRDEVVSVIQVYQGFKKLCLQTTTMFVMHFHLNSSEVHSLWVFFNCMEHRALTVADVEESEAGSRVKSSRNLIAETLHVVVGANGFLDWGVLPCQPAPFLHTAVQPGVNLRNKARKVGKTSEEHLTLVYDHRSQKAHTNKHLIDKAILSERNSSYSEVKLMHAFLQGKQITIHSDLHDGLPVNLYYKTPTLLLHWDLWEDNQGHSNKTKCHKWPAAQASERERPTFLHWPSLTKGPLLVTLLTAPYFSCSSSFPWCTARTIQELLRWPPAKKITPSPS